MLKSYSRHAHAMFLSHVLSSRYPTVRLVFGVYVVLIHLWVMYVMYHFSHHAMYNPNSEMHK